MSILSYSEELFQTVKKAGQQRKTELNRILVSSSNMKDVIDELDTDDKKKACWINLYNSFSYLSLKENPEVLESKNSRSKHFTNRKFLIFDEMLSLDNIEHGILRRKKNKYSLGYLNSPFYPSFVYKLMVDYVDPRIHFALNCGAKSCPLIRFYDWENIDEQLDEAAKSYISQYFVHDKEQNQITISKIFFWFRGDFGRKRGVLNFFKQYGFLDENAQPSITYHKYDWRIYLQDFRND